MAVLLRLHGASAMPAAVIGKRIRIRGTVQGVGFRPWVYRTARQAGVTGAVRNDSGGVIIDAFGDEPTICRFLDALGTPPPAARIVGVDADEIQSPPPSTFEIESSESNADRTISIPPDLATCSECLAEIFDRSNRRYRYAFTNCTHCGPRYTIAKDIPYDRDATTMAAFPMCEACRREYEDPGNRRFHAEPIACPDCGPKLSLLTNDGVPIHADDPIEVAAQAIKDGLIVALKGIGGVHLVCDATSESAVQTLRRRKHREAKPLAVMVRNLRDAERLGYVGAAERQILQSAERPIVLLRKRDDLPIAEAVAPDNRLVGVFLPYSPLHHLLLAEVNRPVVMTSGNLTDEPIACRNDEAIARLGSIADLFLLHDRDIENRCDDSVAGVIAGRGTVLRRGRGYVPRPVRVARGFMRPVLACGALLKNTFCIGAGQEVWLGPHIGDLDNVEAYRSYTSAIARMEKFLRVQTQIVAHDLHPDYTSSQYAASRPERLKIAVQHHHSHVVSVMAEHGIDGPAIGIAYDGAGYGLDGTSWGGEILVATRAAFRRVATFRPLPLVGGDRAVQEPWRLAAALLDDAYGGSRAVDVQSQLGPAYPREIWRLLAHRQMFALARGVGRYFDAFGALFLRRKTASFEGQIALEWNQAADPADRSVYTFDFHDRGDCFEIDLRSTVHDAVRDRLNGESIAHISAAFHNTLAEATATAVRRVVSTEGRLPIVASGGCFQNARLAEGIRTALAPEHDVLFHAQVPPGDGGIALGQAVIADAIARGGRCA